MVDRIIAFFDYISGYGFTWRNIARGVFILLLLAAAFAAPSMMQAAGLWLVSFWPVVWVPALVVAAAMTWLAYVRSHNYANRKYILLEVRIPRDSIKSPKAMAVIFNGILVGGRETTFIDRWWLGKTRPQFSFELVSIEGMLHFYVHLEEAHKDFVSSHIYAQYPDAEITEVEDYTAGVHYDPDAVGMLALEYKKAKPDPYPIKTYVDYGVDQDPSKLEQRVDPLAGVFEFFSSIGPGEQLWLQLVLRRNRPWKIGFGPFKLEYDWHKGAQQQIDSIYASLVEEEIAPGVKAKGKSQLTPAQEEEVRALARTLHAEGIDVGMRLIYIARKEAFQPAKRAAPGMVKLWREFRTPNLNAIVPNGKRGFVAYDYPWQREDKNLPKDNKVLLDAYRRRCFFYPPYVHKYMIMSPEELATIYHFPSYEIKTPGLTRVESRKSTAPANLPI